MCFTEIYYQGWEPVFFGDRGQFAYSTNYLSKSELVLGFAIKPFYKYAQQQAL